jgi:cytochrome P450
MAHLLLALAQHPDAQARIAADPGDDRYLDRVIAETQRLYPLFGIAHRITSADIEVGGRTFIPAGSVLCFNYPAFHRAGYDDPDRFDPDRWTTLSTRTANHIPFGITANRPCPARGLAPVTMRAATREILSRLVLHSSAAHTRSIPNRGPCLLQPRRSPPWAARPGAALLAMRVRDRWEDVWRSIVQLLLGSYMVADARRQRLCARHFENPGGAR